MTSCVSYACALGGLFLTLILLQVIAPMSMTAGLVPALIFQGLLLVSISFTGRSYGLAPATAALAGFAVCLSSYMLYFHAGGGDGIGAPMSAVFFSWAALRRVMRAPAAATASLLAAFFLLLVLVTGRAIEYTVIVTVLVACCLEDVSGGGRRTGWMAAAAALAIACYLPLMGGLRVTWEDWIVSTGKLTPGMGQVLNLSNPVWLPHIESETGKQLPFAPLFFAAWFALPMLFYIDWQRFEWKKHIPFYCVAGVFLLMATGAERIGPLFWPIDWLPYVHAVLFILLFLAFEQGPVVVTPERLWWSLGGLLITSYAAIMDNPVAVLPVLGLLALPVVLTYGLNVFLRQKDRKMLVLFLGGTTAILAVLLMRIFPEIYATGIIPPRQQSLFIPRHAWQFGDFLAPVIGFLIWLYFAAADTRRST